MNTVTFQCGGCDRRIKGVRRGSKIERARRCGDCLDLSLPGLMAQ